MSYQNQNYQNHNHNYNQRNGNRGYGNREPSKVFKDILAEITKQELSKIDLKKMIGHDGLVSKFANETKMKANQIRKIFNEVRKIQRKLDSTDVNLDKIKDDLTLLYPKISYAKNRKAGGHPLIPDEFAQFLFALLDKVLKENSKTGFKKFVNIMEAFVGFAKKDN